MSNKPVKVLTEEGLKVLWNQISLDDYPNNDLLIAVLDGIDATKADKTEVADAKKEVLERLEAVAAAGADWNQSDENAIDFIKNRTHYEYTDSQTIMETQIIDVSQGGWYQLNIIEGETYTVTVDEIPYECIARIGNIDELALVNDELNQFLEITQEFKGWTFSDYDSNISYEISIHKNSSSIKQLDEKFIPDTIARKSDLQNIDLSSLETKSDAASKLQEAKDYSDANLEVAQAYADTAKAQAITEGANSAVNTINTKLVNDYYDKEQVDNYVLITTDEIDTIWGTTIVMASEVTF